MKHEEYIKIKMGDERFARLNNLAKVVRIDINSGPTEASIAAENLGINDYNFSSAMDTLRGEVEDVLDDTYYLDTQSDLILESQEYENAIENGDDPLDYIVVDLRKDFMGVSYEYV